MVPTVSLGYFPPVSWFALLWQNDCLIVEAQEHFQKGTIRNRCYIAGANGIQRLSIPLVKGKNQQQPIREVRIAYDEPWQRQHWRSIKTSYGNAPYWEHFEDTLLPFFEKKHVFLFDFNLELLHWLMTGTGCRSGLLLSEAFATSAHRDLNPPIPSNPEEWPNWFTPVPYPQVFLEKTGFLPNLSVLDLLFCCGNRAGEILEKSVLPA